MAQTCPLHHASVSWSLADSETQRSLMCYAFRDAFLITTVVNVWLSEILSYRMPPELLHHLDLCIHRSFDYWMFSLLLLFTPFFVNSH